MGTSASSKGPVGGVPMVPPWVPDLGPPQPTPTPPVPPPDEKASNPADGHSQQLPSSQNQPAPEQAPVVAPAMPTVSPLAPPARFGGARLNLGRFASSGGSQDMRRGLGHYVRRGYGGGGSAVRAEVRSRCRTRI